MPPEPARTNYLRFCGATIICVSLAAGVTIVVLLWFQVEKEGRLEMQDLTQAMFSLWFALITLSVGVLNVLALPSKVRFPYYTISLSISALILVCCSACSIVQKEIVGGAIEAVMAIFLLTLSSSYAFAFKRQIDG